MRYLPAFLLFMGFMNSINAKAQYPDQFYTNGRQMDVWRAEEGRKTILWFFREPGDKISYRQSLVIIYDDRPEWAYYVNLGTRKFVGRYSFRLDKYSILPEDARREDRGEIPEEAFPEPGDLPTVDQLISESKNQNTLLDPPPTKSYPGLRTSSWDSTYFTAQRQMIKAKISFNGDKGTYRFRSGGEDFQGTLSDVQYETTSQGLFLIKGVWTLGGNQGYFRFTVAPDNLNLFQGEWGRNGTIEGSWSGTRLRDE
jgi:hypothetical protein